MALEKTWKCDRCGHRKVIDSWGNDSRPSGWTVVEVGVTSNSVVDKRLLCPDCTAALKQFIEQGPTGPGVTS